MAKFCGQCGAQLNDNATFCTQCGATIAPQQPAQQTASPMANLQQAAKNIDMNAIKDAVSVENIKNLKNLLFPILLLLSGLYSLSSAMKYFA